MNEKPFFFQNKSYNLFGILHQPGKYAGKEGFVFCHPFAEEKLWTQRVFVNFARKLAKTGYPVLRFDFMGHGDSDGNFEDSSIETRLSDIDCAICTLLEKNPEIQEVGLLGLRLGASLASIAAEQSTVISKLILWDPIIDGNKYMQEMLLSNLATQMAVYRKIRHNRKALIKKMREGGTVNIDGYEISYKLFEQASSINLINKNKDYRGDCLIAQIGKSGQILREDIQILGSIYRNVEIAHIIEEPFWKEIKVWYPRAENLFYSSIEWLEGKNG